MSRYWGKYKGATGAFNFTFDWWTSPARFPLLVGFAIMNSVMHYPPISVEAVSKSKLVHGHDFYAATREHKIEQYVSQLAALPAGSQPTPSQH